jgi:hypothetical protein
MSIVRRTRAGRRLVGGRSIRMLGRASLADCDVFLTIGTSAVVYPARRSSTREAEALRWN